MEDIKNALSVLLDEDQIEEIDEYIKDFYGGSYEKYITDLIMRDYVNNIETHDTEDIDVFLED